MEIEIKIPKWADKYKDEGLLTFLAFVWRITDTYGEEDWYTINVDDLTRICNKRADGLVEWLRSHTLIHDNLELGQPLDGVVIFKWRVQQPRVGTHGRNYYRMGSTTAKLTDTRQQMVWMYLLGCFNTNLITEDKHNVPFHACNSFGVKWFQLTREASKYIKKKDRCVEED
jgi:hypothetical protein